MKCIITLLSLFFVLTANAQNEKQTLHAHIDTLTSPAMHGRGYVQGGREKASAYIQAKFREYGLQPVFSSHQMVQHYAFPVNTFPGKVELIIGGKRLKTGDDYIIDASSASFTGRNLPVEEVDMTESLKSTLKRLDDKHIYVLNNFDSACKMNEMRAGGLVAKLPKGCYIIPQQHKLTWTVSQKQAEATVFHVKAASLPAGMQTASANVRARYREKMMNENIIAKVQGEVKDTFIVFSAHYDHLGMMGDTAYFPGASDNASGTAMILYMASWFAVHPPHYSVIFIAFSGEEAGLMGSAYYVANPAVPLSQIKFLTNVDIMGDATDGVTVVNATVYSDQFALLNKINDEHKYLPVIKSRGKAANSDHYFFSERGVPAFFMYSNGGKGYYHDIFDTGKKVTLNNVDGVVKLLIDFATHLN